MTDQEGFVFEANIIIASLSRVERGISNHIWITVLCIAAALGVSLTELTIAIEDEENHALTRAHISDLSVMWQVRSWGSWA